MDTSNDFLRLGNIINGTTAVMITEPPAQTECRNASTPGNATLPPCKTESNEGDSNLQYLFSIIVSVVVAILMIGIGCAVNVGKISRHFKNPTGILTGLVCQFVVMPVLAYAWARIFTMRGPETLALLIIGSCPGGTLSNLIAYWVGGDMELSATMTTISITASLGMIPLLLLIYSTGFDGDEIAVPFETIGITMALIIVPLSIGAFLRFKFPRVADKLLKICSVCGIVAIFLVVGFAIYVFLPYWTFDIPIVIITIFYPLLGMILGYAITSIVSIVAKPLRLNHRQRRTVSIETGIQNQQVALSIIQLAGWPINITGRMTVLSLMYGLTQLAWSLILIGVFHVVSFARDGECPQLLVEYSEAPKKQPASELETAVDNPAFDDDE